MTSDWLEFRPEATHGALFMRRQRKPLALNSLLRPSDGVCRRAGLDREGVTLHTLRHTLASLLLQEGCDLVSIRDMLGHSDLATTSVYLQVSAPHLQAAVGAASLAHGRIAITSQGRASDCPQYE